MHGRHTGYGPRGEDLLEWGDDLESDISPTGLDAARLAGPLGAVGMTRPPPTVVAVHPGSSLHSGDRLFLECVNGLLGVGCQVTAALPRDGALVRELEQLGADVRILPMGTDAPGEPSGTRAPRPRLRELIAAWRLLGAVRPELVLLSTRGLPLWALLARLRGIVSVSHLHQVPLRPLRWRERLRLVPYRCCARVLVSDEASRRALRRASSSLATRAEVLRTGIAPPMRPRLPREPLESPLQLLYLGRLSPQHGPDLLLSAASLLQRRGIPTQLTVVGGAAEGAEEYERRLRRRADASDGQVEVFGPARDVWRHLVDADIVVVPSRTGPSSGRAALEAILSMRPVIASDTPELRELLVDFPAAHLVPPDDVEAVVEVATDLTEDWSRTVAALPRSRRLALQRHDPTLFHTEIARACGADASARR